MINKAYVLEYIDNERDSEYVWSGRIDKGEPMLRWKAYVIKDHESILPNAMESWCRENKTLEHVRIIKDVTENIDGEAIALLLYFQTNPKICDVKLMSETWVDGNLVDEAFIELPSTFYHEYGKAVNKEVMERADHLQKERDMAIKENEKLNGFIKRINGERMYQEYLQEVTA